MFQLAAGLAAADAADEARDLGRRAGNTINHVVEPVTNFVSSVFGYAYNTVCSTSIMFRGLPEPTVQQRALWRKDEFKRLLSDSRPILFPMFENADIRKTFTHKHVEFACYHPGLALHLFVLFNVKTNPATDQLVYDYFVTIDWRGTHRDALLSMLCETMEDGRRQAAPGKSYETFIKDNLYNRTTLLYHVLADHRYGFSPASLLGYNPDTIEKLNTILREAHAKKLEHR